MVKITTQDTQRTIVITLSGILFILSLHWQIPFINGINEIWAWPWVEYPLFKAYIYLFIPFPILMLCLHFTHNKPSLHPSITISLLTICAILFQIFGLYSESTDFSKLETIILSPYATSYYIDALAINNLSEWISSFHTQELHLHSKTHPPGPIIYHYVIIKVFGYQVAPYASGISICIITSLGVSMTYVFSSLWTNNKREKLTAAALYTLIPGIILFLPEFDQIYPVLSMAMIYSWVQTINGSKFHLAISGLCLSIALGFAYNLLTLGTFYALSGIYAIQQSENRSAAFTDLTKSSVLLLSLTISVYTFIYYLTEYNAIASFNAALAHQDKLISLLDRPHSIALIINIYDFMLGGGILILPLSFFYALDLYKNRTFINKKAASFTIIGWITILVVNLSGLLDYETARVWLFLQPFVLVPAAIGLANMNRYSVYVIFTVQWFILSTVKNNLIFINV